MSCPIYVAKACKDRTLITQLRVTRQHPQSPPTAAAAASWNVYVVNCHLSAGPQAGRRLKQAHEAVECIRKQVVKDNKAATAAAASTTRKAGKKKKRGRAAAGGADAAPDEAAAAAAAAAAAPLPSPVPPAAPAMVELEDVAVVFCGDFNSQGSTAVRELLCSRAVEPEFRESGDPTEREQACTPITSKRKVSALSAFADAYSTATAGTEPSTLICPSVDHAMINLDTGAMTPGCEAQLKTMFDKHSSDGGATMSRADTERWLLAINKELGRGSEYRACEKLLLANTEAGKGEHLEFADLKTIYQDELDEGKVATTSKSHTPPPPARRTPHAARRARFLSATNVTSDNSRIRVALASPNTCTHTCWPPSFRPPPPRARRCGPVLGSGARHRAVHRDRDGDARHRAVRGASQLHHLGAISCVLPMPCPLPPSRAV